MSKIDINDINHLYLLGFELFQDSESFLDELTDRDTNNIIGGQNLVVDSVVTIETNNIDNRVFVQTAINNKPISAGELDNYLDELWE